MVELPNAKVPLVVEGALEADELGLAIVDVVVPPASALLVVVEAWLLVDDEVREVEEILLELPLVFEEGDDETELEPLALVEVLDVLELSWAVFDPVLVKENPGDEGTFRLCPISSLSQSIPGFAPFNSSKLHPSF